MNLMPSSGGMECSRELGRQAHELTELGGDRGLLPTTLQTIALLALHLGEAVEPLVAAGLEDICDLVGDHPLVEDGTPLSGKLHLCAKDAHDVAGLAGEDPSGRGVLERVKPVV